jgi:DNA-3-methyladenine glycosylase I
VARFGKRESTRLLANPGIIRNRAKVAATISNAKAFLALQEEFGSFADYMWRFVNGQPVPHRFKAITDIPATSPVSDVMSKDLRKRGFSFVGSTICYAHMQAVGMVNDHLVSCFRHDEVRRLAPGRKRRTR